MPEPTRNSEQVAAGPFLKWAGGKSRLLPQYAAQFPSPRRYSRYVEPFLGGGAVFFRLQPPVCRLADVNPDLIEAYRVVQQQVEELIEALAGYRNDHDEFYRVRDELEPATLSPVERVARLIYLNRTCFNGLYRVNSEGRFNVPFGRYKNPTICDGARLRAASAALAGAELLERDFAAATADLGPGDFVYFDPPYHPVSATANFTAYARDRFGEAEQRRLAEVYHRLADAGCLLMQSNSYTPLVRELYAGRGYRLVRVQAARVINSDPAGRGVVTELLILNYPRPR